MLIDLLLLKEKYNINPKTVLHVGAHIGEEWDLYSSLGVEDVVWIEANKILASNLNNQNFLNKTKPNNKVLCEVIGENDGDIIHFNISNNNQSSSILNLGEHSQLFPSIYYSSSEERKIKSISTVLSEIGNPKIDFINLDIQGAELLALKGYREISDVQFIYTEINSREVYEGCALINQIDEYLKPFGFNRVETCYWENHPWGDALYIK
jgi:FkbM family methyltransferase